MKLLMSTLRQGFRGKSRHPSLLVVRSIGSANRLEALSELADVSGTIKVKVKVAGVDKPVDLTITVVPVNQRTQNRL